MAERKRSKDGVSETRQYRQPEAGNPGRSGGDLARDVGTRDELKRARDDRAGVTRVRKSEEQDRGERNDSER